MNKKLTQGTNTGTLIGILSEKKLELINSFVPNTNPRVACTTIKGHIIIATANGDFRVEVYQNSKTKAGEDNKMYIAVATLYKEYVSKVDVAQNSALTADNVSVRIQADANDYYSDKAKKMISGVRFKLVGCNRAGEKESTTGVELCGYVNVITPEIRNTEPTGRAIVEFITFGYEEKAIPFTLVVSEEDNDDWFGHNISAGMSCELNIEPRYVTVGQKKKQASLGRSVVTSDGFDVLELTVVGAKALYEDEDSEFFYDAKSVAKALSERKVYLEQVEADGKKGKKPAVAPKVSQQEATASFEDDDVPF